MVRSVKTGELFATFNYDGKDCADMGIYNVTSGAVYTMNIEPTFSDKKLEVPAYDGKYYYGTQITGQQFQFNCFCHDLLATEYDRMRAWLNPRKIGRLILSDQPYKYYLVKPVSVSTLGAYPLTTIQTPQNSLFGRYAPEDVVYTGNFTVTFETVGSAYGYGLSYYRDDLIYDAVFVYGKNYYYDTGLLYKDMCPKANWEIQANAELQPIPLYNPGSAAIAPRYLIHYEGVCSKNTFIQFTNNTTNTSMVVDMSDLGGDIVLDLASQTITQTVIITDENGKEVKTEKHYYGRFTGQSLTLNPHGEIIDIPETFTVNDENVALFEFNTFYIVGNRVYFTGFGPVKITQDLVGKYFSVNHNGGSRIIAVDETQAILTLDPDVLTYDIPRQGCRYIYREVDNVLPSDGDGAVGEVCVVDEVWYTYRYDKWEKTSLFSTKDEFKDSRGNYIEIYRPLGATIVELDNLVITTGNHISYKDAADNNTIKEGNSMNSFTMEAEILPRYL